MMLCFQEIECLIETLLRFTALILSFKVCLHSCSLGCCELDQRTGPAFKNSDFCVSQQE